MSFFVMGSSKRRPIRRFTAKTVFSGLVTAWRFAGWPISRSPSLAKATIDGVVRAPSAFSMTLGLPPSITATQLLVVPRSIPITLAIGFPTSLFATLDAALRPPVHGKIGWRLEYAADIGVLRLGTRETRGYKNRATEEGQRHVEKHPGRPGPCRHGHHGRRVQRSASADRDRARSARGHHRDQRPADAAGRR